MALVYFALVFSVLSQPPARNMLAIFVEVCYSYCIITYNE